MAGILILAAVLVVCGATSRNFFLFGVALVMAAIMVALVAFS